MTTATVPSLLRLQIDRWASDWLRSKFLADDVMGQL